MSAATTDASQPWNLQELLPEHFEKFFEFFRPAHTGGILPSRVKELARIKIAALNGCDT